MSATADLSGKTFVITGANTGIGRANALALAERRIARLVIAARSLERTKPVLDEVRARNPDGKVDFIELDLGDLASVRRAADEILDEDVAIDVLVNNAGVAGVQGQTKDGFELAFGTNHVGHYLFTEKLLPLARRLAGTTVTTYALHPGGVASDIWKRRLGPLAILLRPFLITNEKGARTQLRCETAPELAGETGLYYAKETPKAPSRLALDPALQDELKARSDEYVKRFF